MLSAAGYYWRSCLHVHIRRTCEEGVGFVPFLKGFVWKLWLVCLYPLHWDSVYREFNFPFVGLGVWERRFDVLV